MLTNEWKWSASVVSVILVMATMTPAALAKSAGKKSVEEAITKIEMESAKADMAGQNETGSHSDPRFHRPQKAADRSAACKPNV